MEQSEILALSAVSLGRALKNGETTVVEAVEAVLAQIARVEENVHSYITLDAAGALARAAEVQRKIETGELTGLLAGVPMAIKDNLCTEGMRTTCASKLLEHFVPSYSAEAVKRLEAEGAILLGKVNLDEFAMGSTTETSAFGVTGNPHHVEYSPGGSSGGSAAAVAAGECFFSLGTDTGGSVRQPASHCGVVGMKPTYGTISRYGVVAYASSLDQVGMLTKTVEDCAAVLEVAAAYDEKDATSLKREDTDFLAALKKDVQGLRIGMPRVFFEEELDVEVKEAVFAAAEAFRANGAVVEEFDLPLMEYAMPTYYTIAAAEAGSNLARFDGVKYGYREMNAEELHQMYKRTRSQGLGTEVKRRIMLGSYVLSAGHYEAYYLKALKVRALIKKAFDEAFQKYDCILTPTAPATAPKLGENPSDPTRRYRKDIYTVPVNLAGLPALSMPCGKDKKGLPIGFQLIGDCFQEKKLLRAAYTYEQLCKEGR